MNRRQAEQAEQSARMKAAKCRPGTSEYRYYFETAKYYSKLADDLFIEEIQLDMFNNPERGEYYND